MLTCLKNMNFGDSFIKWIKTLYCNIKGCVKNNNWITECYDIAVEYLGARIRGNIDISGIKIGTNHVKIAQLADDTTLFLKYSEILKGLQIVEEFGSFSGLKLNKIQFSHHGNSL